MIVPDGRTDPEKLRELLGNPEETHLDLKAKVDLTNSADKLKFVKDAVTMSNRPPGGYILVGVDDAGNPSMPIGTIADRSRFDGSRIGALIRGYVEADIHVLAQVQELDGNEIVVIYVQNRGLPVPFSKDGEYVDLNGRPQKLFRKGEIFVREGAENVPIRFAHWHEILSQFALKHRDEGAATAQSVLGQIVSAHGVSPAGAFDVPLLLDMDEPTYSRAVVTLLRNGEDILLRQLMRALCSGSRAETLEEFNRTLLKWTAYCIQCLHSERQDLVADAIANLVAAYNDLDIDVDANRRRLSVVEHAYVLGSFAVRLEAWESVTALVLQPVPSETHGDQYMWSSWLRHGQVLASRSNLTDDSRGGAIISAARELMVGHPALRPDLSNAQVPAQDVTSGDRALNSLCEFDIAYCLIVGTLGSGHGSAFPSSAAFDEARAKPMAQRIVSSKGIRQRLFPGADDARIAESIDYFYVLAVIQSGNSIGSRWWDMPQSVAQWVSQHRPEG